MKPSVEKIASSREIRHDAKPGEKRLPRGSNSAAARPAANVARSKSIATKLSAAGNGIRPLRAARASRPASRDGRLQRSQVLRGRRAIGRGIEAGAEYDELARAAFYGHRQRILGDAAAGRDEPAQALTEGIGLSLRLAHQVMGIGAEDAEDVREGRQKSPRHPVPDARREGRRRRAPYGLVVPVAWGPVWAWCALSTQFRGQARAAPPPPPPPPPPLFFFFFFFFFF